MSWTEIARGRNSYHKLPLSYKNNINLKGKMKLLSFLKLCTKKPQMPVFYENIFDYWTFS